MSEMLARLAPGDVPVFRRTRDTLIELAPRRDGLTAREVALEVLMDPLATLRVLHLLNQRMGQRYGTEVATVEHALMMQGLGAFLDSARSLPIVEDTAAGQDPAAYRGLQALVRRVQHAAWQARDFAVLHSDIRAEEVQVAAILAHLPELLLQMREPGIARKLDARRRSGAGPESEAELLGAPLPTFRLALLESWSIPELTRDLLDARYADRARQTILGACLDIAFRTERGWWDDGLLADYQALADVEGTPYEVIVATAHGNGARAARCCDWLAAPAPGAWLPLIPGPWPEEAEPEENAPAKAAPPDTQTATPPGPAQRETASPPARADESGDDAHLTCPMPDKQVFREALKGIEGHLDGSLTLNQMSAIILKGLHTGLGLSRILFAMVTPDGARVKSRFSLGIPSHDPLRHLEFALADKDLFGQLMGKMQGVWINETNREKLWPRVDPRLRELIGSGDFYAMSLYNGSRPLGLVYADRGHGECGLDPLTYTDFKMICLQAARGLGKVKDAR